MLYIIRYPFRYVLDKLQDHITKIGFSLLYVYTLELAFFFEVVARY